MQLIEQNKQGLFPILWEQKWVIIVVTMMFAISAVFIAFSLPNKYRAEVILAPATDDAGGGAGGLASLASQMGGLANLAGISLSGGDNNKVGQALALLKSRTFLQHFIQKRQLLPDLLALESWDLETNQYQYNAAVYDKNSETWVRTPPKNKAVIPTPWEGYAILLNMLEINDSATDGTLTLSIDSLSPQLSKRWLEWLVEDLNQTIAAKELNEARKSIVFLKKQIESTKVQELQSIFYRLIEEQTKKVLLGEVRDEYVFTVLAEPVLPEDRSFPSRALVVLGISFLGGLFSLVIVLFRVLWGR